MKQLISHSRLIELLDYDPLTGIFTRKTNWWKQKVGDVPGGQTPQGYWYIGIDAGQYPAHRLAWFYIHKEWPQSDIDHINRNKMDNRIANLRSVSRSLNCCNSPTRAGSGVKGVYRTKCGKKWESTITKNGVTYYLGTFNTLEEATNARKFAQTIILGI